MVLSSQILELSQAEQLCHFQLVFNQYNIRFLAWLTSSTGNQITFT